MKQTFDIIITGGGIYGASIFYHITKNSDLSVLLVEKNKIASGATSKSKGFIRSYHSSLYQCELAIRSNTFFKGFENNLRCPFINSGFLTIENIEKIEQVQMRIHFLKINGCEVELYDSKTFSKYSKQFSFPVLDNRLYILEKDAGYISPKGITEFFINEGVKSGGTVLENFHVEKFVKSNKRIYKLTSSNRQIAARIFVLAAGASSDEILSKYTEYKNLEKKTIHLGLFTHDKNRIPILPFLDKDIGIFGRHLHDNFCFLGLTKATAFGDNLSKNKNIYLKNIETIAKEYFGDEKISLIEDQSGVELYNKDNQGIAEFSQSVSNLFVCTGWSGIGFKMSWEIGRFSAEKILKQYMEEQMNVD